IASDFLYIRAIFAFVGFISALGRPARAGRPSHAQKLHLHSPPRYGIMNVQGGEYMLCIAAGALAAASLLAPLACALWPALARLWLRAVFIPVSGALSALADRCPFPLFELLAPLFLALLIFCLF